MYELELYQTANGKCPVREFMQELHEENNQTEITQLKLCMDRLKEHGMQINTLYPKTIRKIRNDIWEVRPGSNRVFFFHYTGKKLVLLHAYRKQGQKAPAKEIERAEKEMKDYRRRN